MEAAELLGGMLAKAGIRLVYGDGGIGLMAAVAKCALDAGGEVLGVIPQFMVDQGWNNPRFLDIRTKTFGKLARLCTCRWICLDSSP
jgi:predicted Rossmann-fold nucleotide-binding protein